MQVAIILLRGRLVVADHVGARESVRLPLPEVLHILARLLNDLRALLCAEDVRVLVGLARGSWLQGVVRELAITLHLGLVFNGARVWTGRREVEVTLESGGVPLVLHSVRGLDVVVGVQIVAVLGHHHSSGLASAAVTLLKHCHFLCGLGGGCFFLIFNKIF
jgi:hypothetical protein